MVTVTERFAEELSLRGIKDVRIISNGADINIFRPQSKLKKNNFRQNIGLRDNDFVLVFCGTIGGYYRIDILIKSLKNVNQRLPNVKLILVGSGPDLKKILNLIDSLEMREFVIYLGVKSDAYQIVEILSASDVGIIPYDSNPLWKNAIPVKSLEYLACGLPIIATLDTNSVLGRLIMENQVGMLCEPENVLELSKIIEKVYHDKVFVENASKRAVSLIHTHFDRNKLAEEYYHIIK
jgi:glycosyltransferase involved in cell wall biosynthesis